MHSFLALPGMMQVAKRRVGIGAGDTVGRKAEIQLELAKSQLGESTKNTVGLTARESERTEGTLQLEHILAMKVGHAQI